jgi:hypothetical protein
VRSSDAPPQGQARARQQTETSSPRGSWPSRARSTRPNAVSPRLEKDLATSELYADGERSRKVVTEHRQLKGILEGLYEDWTGLMEEAEEVGL